MLCLDRALGQLSANAEHRSFFREQLQRMAGPRVLEDWLVEEANLRGHLGAVGTIPDRPPTAQLSEIDIVVAALMLHAPADGRIFKLVVRLLQRSVLDPRALWLAARRERADRVLYWLLKLVPASEQTPSILNLLEAHPRAPRGCTGMNFNYDPGRLIRRPATRESVWRAAKPKVLALISA